MGCFCWEFLPVYACAMMFADSIVGSVSLFAAIFLLLLSNSFSVALYIARLGACVVTLWRYDD